MPLAFPKPERKKSKKHLVKIADIGCAICGKVADPHHLDSSGVGTKGSDWLTVPLCRVHHMEYHSIGRLEFEDKYSVNLWRVCATLLAEELERGKK